MGEALIDRFRTKFKAKGKLQLVSRGIVFPLLVLYLFSRISAAAFISSFTPQMLRLFESGAYLRTVFI